MATAKTEARDPETSSGQKELSIYDRLSVQTKIDAETIAIIHNSVAKGTSPIELAYFLNVAKGVDLNPFNKEIWCYKDGRGNLIIVTARDGFLKKAQQHPRYNGFRSSDVCEKDDFEMEITNDGVKITHKIKPNVGGRGHLLGAYCICYFKDGNEFVEWVDFARYDKGVNTWKTHPEEMIKKVAESHALKKCFGITGLQAMEDFEVVNGSAVPVANDEYRKEKVQERIQKLEVRSTKLEPTNPF